MSPDFDFFLPLHQDFNDFQRRRCQFPVFVGVLKMIRIPWLIHTNVHLLADCRRQRCSEKTSGCSNWSWQQERQHPLRTATYRCKSSTNKTPYLFVLFALWSRPRTDQRRLDFRYRRVFHGCMREHRRSGTRDNVHRQMKQYAGQVV